MASPDRTRRTWTEVLDALEADALFAVSDPDPEPDRGDAAHLPAHRSEEHWRPDPELGALPDELHERAAEVLALQREMLELLIEERRSVRRHLEAVRTVPDVAASGAVYLDVQG
ncbi:hypothetical protein WJX64_06655 [Leifsonia sp. YIM 134122]|uniref:Uncharacterized protein n=1 Tax=Leifsonia stereocauli TaxID=3134136 RepID=A0ABU9W2J6_9MICO